MHLFKAATRNSFFLLILVVALSNTKNYETTFSFVLLKAVWRPVVYLNLPLQFVGKAPA